jgi:hypothetical protein
MHILNALPSVTQNIKVQVNPRMPPHGRKSNAKSRYGSLSYQKSPVLTYLMAWLRHKMEGFVPVPQAWYVLVCLV